MSAVTDFTGGATLTPRMTVQIYPLYSAPYTPNIFKSYLALYMLYSS
jgi:hypothetical protein